MSKLKASLDKILRILEYRKDYATTSERPCGGSQVCRDAAWEGSMEKVNHSLKEIWDDLVEGPFARWKEADWDGFSLEDPVSHDCLQGVESLRESILILQKVIERAG